MKKESRFQNFYCWDSFRFSLFDINIISSIGLATKFVLTSDKIRAAKVGFLGFWFYLVKKEQFFFVFLIIFSINSMLHTVQTKLFTVYLMIFGDCDNNFVFINALKYTIYACYFFLFLGYKPNKQTKTFDFEKNLFFCTPGQLKSFDVKILIQ